MTFQSMIVSFGEFKFKFAGYRQLKKQQLIKAI